MLVHLGPEQSIDIEVDIIGFLDDNAPQFKALIVFIEHRYQGESIPKGPIEKVLRDKENRGYFNSAQALADFAEIILYLKTKLSARYSPVIVSGGSYGGMLAAWFRLKYPHIALGALASSAPVLLHSIKSPYVYFDWASKDFKDLKLALQKFGSNIIFSNGLRDPLSQLGVLEDLSDTLLAIHTKEGSHCLDLLRSSKSDPEWLNMLRQKETAIIHDWLANYYVDLRAYLPGSK